MTPLAQWIGTAYIKSVDYDADLGSGVMGIQDELHPRGLGDIEVTTVTEPGSDVRRRLQIFREQLAAGAGNYDRGDQQATFSGFLGGYFQAGSHVGYATGHQTQALAA